MLRATLPALLLALPAAAAQLGDPVDEAVAVHITPLGLGTLGDAVAALAPEVLAVDALDGVFECAPDDARPLAYAMDPIDILLSVDEVALQTTDGRLDLTLYATIDSTPATLEVTGDCSVLVDLVETCDVQVPTTAVEVHLGMSIEAVDDGFDVVVDDVDVQMSPIGNPLADCTLASAVGTVLGEDPWFITDTLLSFVEPSLADIAPELEAALEGIFDQLAFDTSLPLGAASLDLSLYASHVALDDLGIVLGLGAAVDVETPSDCVDWESGLTLTGAGWPELSTTAAGTSLEYDAGLLLGKDFVDTVLFAAWASGALCLQVRDLAGAELSTDLLAGLAGDDFAALFPDDRPAHIQVDPGLPTARFEDDGAPVHVDAVLGLDVYAELDHRDARIFRSDLTADIGLAVGFDTEMLALSLDIPEGALQARDAGSEYIGPGWSDGLGDLADVAIGAVLPEDLLPTLMLPSLLGMEVGAVIWLPSEGGAWQGAYVVLETDGVEPLVLPGCGADALGCDGGGGGIDFDLAGALGCDGEAAGCSGGSAGAECATVPMGPVWMAALVVVGFLRRRG